MFNAFQFINAGAEVRGSFVANFSAYTTAFLIEFPPLYKMNCLSAFETKFTQYELNHFSIKQLFHFVDSISTRNEK